jgi:hypothetical protein
MLVKRPRTRFALFIQAQSNNLSPRRASRIYAIFPTDILMDIVFQVNKQSGYMKYTAGRQGPK